MGKPKIVTFSGKARAGKDSSCEYLVNKLQTRGYKVVRIGYADYVKYNAAKYFGWNGEKDEAGRTLLQQIGTEKVRTKNPDFWVNNVIEAVKVLFDDYDFVFISDCRFPNEITRWKEEGYDVTSVLVERPGFDNGMTEEQKNHLSEIALDDWKFDHVIQATNLQELQGAVMDFFMMNLRLK